MAHDVAPVRSHRETAGPRELDRRVERVRAASLALPGDGLGHVLRLLDGAAGATRVLDAGVRLPRF